LEWTWRGKAYKTDKQNTKKSNINKQNKKQTNKQKGFKPIGSLTFFAFYAENSVNNQICVIKSQIVLPSFFSPTFQSVGGALLCPWFTCNALKIVTSCALALLGMAWFVCSSGIEADDNWNMTICNKKQFCVYMDDSLVLSLLKKNQYYYFRNFYLRNDHFTFREWVCFLVCIKMSPNFIKKKYLDLKDAKLKLYDPPVSK